MKLRKAPLGRGPLLAVLLAGAVTVMALGTAQVVAAWWQHPAQPVGSAPRSADPGPVATPTPLVTPTAAEVVPARPSASQTSPRPAVKPAAKATHLVVLGDSVPAGSACQCAGFADDLSASLGGTVVNAAVAGLTSQGLLDQLGHPAVQSVLKQATVVTVTIGANDFNEAEADDATCRDLACYDEAMTGLAANLSTILTRLHALVPNGSTVVVTGYWNVFRDGQVGAAKGSQYVQVSDALTRKVNSHITAASTDHDADYSDLYGPFKGAGADDDTALLASDGDHPNAAGHALIAAAIQRTLRAA